MFSTFRESTFALNCLLEQFDLQHLQSLKHCKKYLLVVAPFFMMHWKISVNPPIEGDDEVVRLRVDYGLRGRVCVSEKVTKFYPFFFLRQTHHSCGNFDDGRGPMLLMVLLPEVSMQRLSTNQPGPSFLASRSILAVILPRPMLTTSASTSRYTIVLRRLIERAPNAAYAR